MEIIMGSAMFSSSLGTGITPILFSSNVFAFIRTPKIVCFRLYYTGI